MVSDYGAYPEKEPSPQDVNSFHRNSDADSSFFAQHHTIGTKPNQAASGNHQHLNLAGQEWVLNPTYGLSVPIAHTTAYTNYYELGNFVFFNFRLTINQTTADHVYIDLPITPRVYVPGTKVSIGHGREDAITGHVLQVATAPAVGLNKALITGEMNATTINNGWALTCSGLYEKAT